MGLKGPRGRYERIDLLLPTRVWGTPDLTGHAVAATCRNLSARGCRFQIEDSKFLPGIDIGSPIHFSMQLTPSQPELGGAGQVVWFKRERGEAGKIRLVLGVEFTSVSFADRERIKAFIIFQVDRQK